jgi:hypothetical protein
LGLNFKVAALRRKKRFKMTMMYHNEHFLTKTTFIKGTPHPWGSKISQIIFFINFHKTAECVGCKKRALCLPFVCPPFPPTAF